MQKLILLVFIIFLTIACNSKEVRTFTKFPSVFSLEGERIHTEVPFKFGTLYPFDSLLIVTNTFDSKKYIHLYNRTKYSYISSSANVGNGPGEISNPFLAVPDVQNKLIWVMDHGKRKLLKFPIDSILYNPDYKPSYSVPLPSEQRIIGQYRPFNKDLFSFLNTEYDPIISFFNHKGNVVDSLNVLNYIRFYSDSWAELKNSNIIPYIHMFKPSRDKVAVAFRFADIVKIIDLDGNLLGSIQGPDIINKDPLLPLTESLSAYFDVRVDDYYIYCLYNGKQKLFEKDGKLISSYPHNLFVFNWNGKPIARINFEHSVSSFAIDKINHRIVTFSPDSGDFVIYELPEF